jgi:hypothetical protein
VAAENDPRPVLRQELARIFKNQRVIRAFEKLFDLIPPEFINQQIQIDAIDLASEIASAQVNEAAAAIERLAAAVDRLTLAPPVPPVSPGDGDGLVGLVAVPGTSELFARSDFIPGLNQGIVPTWTGAHTWTVRATIAVNTAGANVLDLGATGNGANLKYWRIRVGGGGDLQINMLADDLATVKGGIQIGRSATSITVINYGNAVDLPPHNFLGPVGFNNTPAIAKPAVTGSKGGNAALASLLAALANYGLVTDSST